MRTTRLAALLFVELDAFPDLLARSEGRAFGLLGEFRALAESLLPEHGGQIVDASGEELLVLFESAVAAVQYGLHLFLAADSRNADPGREGTLVLRAGIHLGEIWRDETRVYGNGVNIAARVKAEAEPGSLLVSEDVYRQVSNKLDLFARELPVRSLKNIERSLLLYELVSAAPRDPAVGGAEPEGRPSAGATAGATAAERPPSASAADATAAVGARAVAGATSPPAELRIPLPPLPPPPPLSPQRQRRRKLSFEASSGPEEGSRVGAPAPNREAAEKELLAGLRKFLGAGALCAGLGYAYMRQESFWLALAAVLFGLLPSMSGLKKFLRSSLDLREAKREERRNSSE